MPDKELQSSISELKAQLEQVGEVAEADRQTLAELTGRIELMVAQEREHWEENLVDELERQVILYEEDHPVIARVIQQIILTLNNMGL
ncbi:MAG: DUF4404 family protein [Gammaproteobacteria bacterium]|nr:DUF4404 family protein [Gammaproteobacteria bacterium]